MLYISQIDSTPIWLGTQQAAEFLGVSEASVRRWADQGLIRMRRIGARRERRFRRQDLELFARSTRRPARTAPVAPPDLSALVAGSPVGRAAHLAAFYESDWGRLRLSVPFLADGLLNGQPCYLIAHGATLDAYLEALEAVSGVDVGRALETGLLATYPGPGRTSSEAVAFWEAALWRGLERGSGPMRVVGEMASARELFDSEDEMLSFEAAVDQTIKRFPCVGICQYDVRLFSGAAILRALKAHPDLYLQPLGPFLN